MTLTHYALGCPIWSHKDWVGELFRADAKPADFLRQYSSVFNTVEGNTTFYGLPSADTVARWAADTPPNFRFCFKFLREITHHHRLAKSETDTEHFFARLAPLGTRLGPFLLQLPAGFGPGLLPALDTYLATLPSAYHYAVEVRHPDFFHPGQAEDDLNALLTARAVDRVIFDTRGLRLADPSDPDVRTAQGRKPNLPVRPIATGPHPFVRYVAHPETAPNHPFFTEWVETIASWINAGKHPYFFMHSPNDFYAPRLAQQFHQLLATRAPVGTLPPWPAADAGENPVQLSLF